MSPYTAALVTCVLAIATVNLVLGAQALFATAGAERRILSAAGAFGVTLFALAWFVSITNPLAFAYMRVVSGYAAALSMIGFTLDLLSRATPRTRRRLLIFAGATLTLAVAACWRISALVDGVDLRTLYPRAVAGPLLMTLAGAAAIGVRDSVDKERAFYRRVLIAAVTGTATYLLFGASPLLSDDEAFVDPAAAAVVTAQALTFIYAVRRRAEAREVFSRLLTYVLLAGSVALAAAYALYRLGYPSDPVLVTVTVTVALVASVFFVALSDRMTRLFERSFFPEHAALRQHLIASRGEAATLRRRLQDVERLAVAGELAAKVAHEVKNPLAAVRGYAQLLSGALDALPSDARERFEKGLRVIREESDRIDAQVRELLVLGQRKGPASRDQSCELNHVVVEAIAVAEGDALATRFEVELDGHLGRVHGSADELRGALVNLLKNAAEAKPAARVRVSTRTTQGRAVVDIVDDGPGLSSAACERMFSPFFTTKADGSGLGLCIAKSAVEAAGGTLKLANRSGVHGAQASLLLERVTS